MRWNSVSSSPVGGACPHHLIPPSAARSSQRAMPASVGRAGKCSSVARFVVATLLARSFSRCSRWAAASGPWGGDAPSVVHTSPAAQRPACRLNPTIVSDANDPQREKSARISRSAFSSQPIGCCMLSVAPAASPACATSCAKSCYESGHSREAPSVRPHCSPVLAADGLPGGPALALSNASQLGTRS